MFIDFVDFEISYQLKEVGFKIIRINFDGILHEVGKGRNIRFLNKEFVSYNEPPFRQYYMARNGFYVAKKHPNYFSYKQAIKREIKSWLIIGLFEDRKISKLVSRAKGIKDYRKLLKEI